MKKLTAFFSRFIAILERFSDRPWYFPAAGLIAAIDLFVMVIPTEGLLVSSVLLQPKKWVRAFIMIGTGSGVGAAALGYVAYHYGESVLDLFFEGALHSSYWMKTQAFIDLHGAWSVGLIAFSPFPLQPAVVLAGLAHMSIWSIFLSVWVARIIKFAIYAWLATHAPHQLKKWGWGTERELKEIESEKHAI